MGDLEDALASTEAEAEAAIQGAAAVVRELKRAKASAASGNLRDLRRATDLAAELSNQLVSAARALREGWRIDGVAYFSSGDYKKELIDQARAESLDIAEQDDRLLCYPSVIRVLPTDQSLEIDKKKLRSVRPSSVVKLLKAGQAKQPKFKPEAFLKALEKAYDLALAGKVSGATVPLVEIYRILTLMPGAGRDYTQQEFTRDIYLLDQSGVTRGESGRELQLPASTMTKNPGAVLITVSRDGQQKIYAGLSFS